MERNPTIPMSKSSLREGEESREEEEASPCEDPDEVNEQGSNEQCVLRASTHATGPERPALTAYNHYLQQVLGRVLEGRRTQI